MPTSTTRRPLPALAFLLALTVLTAIVWWRVLHRDTGTSATHAPAVTVAPAASSSCTTHKPAALPKPAAVPVQVLNANGQAGLAATVSGQLKALGFNSAGYGNATSSIPSVGELHYGAAGAPGAKLLSYYLPGFKLIPISRAGATVDVVLGQAYKGLASQASAQAALARAAKPC